jgi:uncharacterized protein (DUF427 family)
MKLPGPDHPIEIAAHKGRLRACVNGVIISETQNALMLREAAYPPVYYFPLADIRSGVLRQTTHSTYCPYKGDASYFDVTVAGETLENAAWSYAEPYEAVSEIQGHIAFYADRVEIIASPDF